MDTTFFIDVASRVTHVFTAIALVGGSLFSVLVLMPAAKLLPDAEHQQLAAAVVQRWKRWVHLGILLFLMTGFYNYFRAMPLHKGDGAYHALIGTKILLALVVFFLASALVGRSASLQRFRDARRFWTLVMVGIAAVIVGISGFAKARGPKGAVSVPPADYSSEVVLPK